ncbi:MAG: hypothetical protein FE78DRAFT_31322 [Acidomyces sp. 'richmondensis']|nr:MAG: hypothetical protein FE78DRAFT_31322 [Acidomyces sp. 'richmondensis']
MSMLPLRQRNEAVSICLPAYYADLLCEHGRAYLFRILAENDGSDTTDSNVSEVSVSNTSYAKASFFKASNSKASGSKVSSSKPVNHEWTLDIHERLKDSTWYI